MVSVAHCNGVTTPRTWRRALLAGSVLMLLPPATAARAAAPPLFSPAWLAAHRSASAAVLGRTGTGGNPASALANVQQSLANMRKAAQAISAASTLQASARAAATAASSVPNGIAVGGLQPAAGYNVSGSGVWLGVNPNQPLTQTTGNGVTDVTITQNAATAVLNWRSFNVGKQTKLTFDQSQGGANAASWVALNRVADPGGTPSQILGAITAPGKVYVINANGIIFGASAQVNVNALIASAANLSDTLFNSSGIYSPVANNGYTPSFAGASAASTIEVSAGAQIVTNTPTSTTSGGGYVMLFGGAVRNDGQIATPDGQTILAAGQDFILRQGYDATQTGSGSLAGNLYSTTLGTEVAVTNGGAATNAGLITATTGDISLIGKTVAQNGVVLSTTSVATRGTVHLLTDTTDPTGSVTLGPASLTTIQPDTGGATALDSQRAALIAQSPTTAPAGLVLLNNQAFLPDRLDESRVEITTGGSVAFMPGSLTQAQGGQVAVSAVGRIFVAANAAIDVSGAVNVALPMSANDVPVNIQGFELRDAPVNRDTTLLNSANVYVNAADLTVVGSSGAYPSVRDYTAGGLLEVSGEVANVGHTVQEWMTLGGTITLAANQVVAQPGAAFNIAGGSVQYQGGYLKTSWLVGADGDLYNVNTAPADIVYTGVYSGLTVDEPRWNVSAVYTNPLIAPSEIYQPGYVVGRNAGTLELSTPTAIFAGTISAGVVVGEKQTVQPPPGVTDGYALAQTVVPLGGTLAYGNYANGVLGSPFNTDLRLTEAVAPIADTLTAGSPLPTARVNTAWFDASAITASGLASLSLSTAGAFVIDAPVTLTPGGQVALIGPAVTLSAAIVAPAASVSIGNALIQPGQPITFLTSAVTGITLGAGGTLDVGGLWTNAQLNPEAAGGIAFVNGGSVALDSSQNVALQSGSAIDVSSGAAIRFNGSVVSGAGGSVALTAVDPLDIANPATADTAPPMTLAGTFHANGVSGGGTLALTLPDVVIGTADAASPRDALALAPAFFTQGFGAYTINGYLSLTVAPGTVVAPLAPSYIFNAATRLAPTGTAPAAAMSLVQLPQFVANPGAAKLTPRPGVSLSLQSLQVTTPGSEVGGPITIGKGALLSVDAGQSVTVEGFGQITVDGAIVAPSGTIAVINPQSDANVPAASLSIWFGPQSTLDVSAQAATALDAQGRPYGAVPNGGAILVGSLPGTNQDGSSLSTPAYVVVRPGAAFDASGTAASLYVVDGSTLEPTQIQPGATGGTVLDASSGGMIAITSYTGIALDGTLRAAAGGPGAAGGTLDLALVTPLYQTTKVDAALVVPRTIVVSQSGQSLLAAAKLQAGDALPAATLGQAAISADQIIAGGFGSLSLSTDDIIQFQGAVALTAAQGITLIASAITETSATASATVRAPTVTLGGVLPSASEPSGNNGVDFLYPSLLAGAPAGGAPFSPSTLVDTGTLTIGADLIDIAGVSNFSLAAAIPQSGATLEINQAGFGSLALNSSGEIRLSGGTLAVPGNIVLRAQQIYGSGTVSAAGKTAASGTLAADGSVAGQGTLAIARVGDAVPALPLSVGDTLDFQAATISQGGIVRAPFGSIVFNGPGTTFISAGSVRFLAGSFTSVSGNGLTDLLGATNDGVTYQVNGAPLSTLPGGTLTVAAQSVTVATGATLDLSGGGTLAGAGFISGRGGSTDTLLTPLLQFNVAAGTATTPADPVYAILRTYQSAYAPSAPSVQVARYTGSLPPLGLQITLPAGVPGLPAGTYTLLPAYYALLPGGYRVELDPSGPPPLTTLALPNGSYLANAVTAIANSGVRAPLSEQAIVTPGSVVRTYSQYDEESPSSFLVAQAAQFEQPRPAQPADAGTLHLEYVTTAGAQQALTFAGTALFAPAPGGIGGTLVVDSADSTTNTDLEIISDSAIPTPGFVSLRALALDAIGAQRISIGGSELVAGADVDFSSENVNSVVLRTGALLSAPEVFLIATSNGATASAQPQILVQNGATISTLRYGAPAYDSTDGFVYQNFDGSAGASVLAVSNGYLNFAPPQTADTVPITIANGAALYTNGTVAFSTLQPVSLGTQASYGAKYISFTSANINIGTDAALASLTTANALPTGLELNQTVLNALLLGNAAVGAPPLQQLTLAAARSINFVGSVGLNTGNAASGQASLQQLVLDTPAIYGSGGAQDVDTIAAGTVVWNGVANGNSSALPGGIVAHGPGTGAGTLNIVATQIVLGYPSSDVPNNQVTLDRVTYGFATVNLIATGEIQGNNLGSLSVYQQSAGFGHPGTGGTLNLVTPLLTGAPGSVDSLTAGGTVTLRPASGASPSMATPDALGAEVQLTGAAIVDSTAIVLPSGQLGMLANTGDIMLGTGARIDLAGQPVGFFEQTIDTPGGTLSLQSTHGNISQNTAAGIDVSALAAAAGTVSVSATQGTVSLAGSILGGAGAGGTPGSIEVGAGTLNDFAGLNARLSQGGVFGARSFDIRTGSLVIANQNGGAAPLLVAHTIDVSVDGGSLTVAGTLDASGTTPGSIRLSAGGDLVLTGNAVLDAHATAAQTDSTGATVDAENHASVVLAVADGTANSGTGTLRLQTGATIDVSAAAGVTCALGTALCGTVEFDVPRTGETSGGLRIAAAGQLTVRGAGSIAVVGFWSYQPGGANGIIVQDNGDGANGAEVSSTGQLGLVQINARSTAFITAALANAALLQQMAGLTAYRTTFHLQPGVEIDSATANGNLTVQGDLDLSAFRYASMNPNSQKKSVYGSGEPGEIVLRAGGNLMVNGSVSDGFGTPPEPPGGAAADPPADNGWILFPSTNQNSLGQETFGSDIILPSGLPAPVTLLAGTQYANTAVPLNYAIPIAAATLDAEAVIPQQVTLAAPLTLATEWVATAAIAGDSASFARGAIIPAGTTLSAGTTLGAGTVMPTQVQIAAGTWNAGSSLAVFAGTTTEPTAGATLAQSVQLTAGDLIPAGTVMQITGSSVNLRPTNATTGVQGLIYGDAPMLAAGSLSWSIRLAAGADLAAADSRTLLPTGLLGGGGNLTLADIHYTPQVSTRRRRGQTITTVTGVNPSFSVIRTGTGNLDVLAGGSLTESSLFGIYTAGTQAPTLGGTISDPVDTLDQGRNQFDLVRGLNGGTSVLGPNGGVFESLVSGVTSAYQAWYPRDGGDVLVAAQGDIVGDILVGATDKAGDGASNAVDNWLWRQGGQVASQAAAYWINFGSYVVDPGALSNNFPSLVGFVGVGALGGGNVTVRAGGDVGPPTDRGSGDGAQSGGLDVAVGATGRVLNGGTLVQTGGGSIDIRIAGALDPDQSDTAGDLGGTLTDLRGGVTVRAGSVGQLPLTFGQAETGDPRTPSAFVSQTATANGGPVVVLGDASVTITTERDLVLAGAADPTRTIPIPNGEVWNTTPFLSITNGVESFADFGGVSEFSLWQPTSGIILLSAGGNVDPFAIGGGANEFGTDGREASFNIFYPPNLSVTAASGSIYYGLPVSIAANLPPQIELAPSPVGQLQMLAEGSIYANAAFGTLPVAMSGASNAAGALPTPLAPAFTNVTNLAAGSAGTITNMITGGITPALFAFEADTPTTDLHRDDAQPMRIYAATGDIVSLQLGGTEEITATGNAATVLGVDYLAAKPARIFAGQDIVGTADLILNDRTTDVSVLSAGRDIVYANVDIAGPGGLYVQAGRNLYQANQGVLESIGEIIGVEAGSRSGGASITAIAGVGAAGPDYTAFANQYFNPLNQANPDSPLDSAANQGKVVETYNTDLLAWLQATYGYTGTAAGALAAFDALAPEQQAVFLLPIYFGELRLSGREDTDPTSPRFKSYFRGREAIAALFPSVGTNGQPLTYNGSITMFSANSVQGVTDGGIRTDFGGGITLLAPGGQTVVGVNGVTPGAHAGLLTQGSGDIDVYSLGSVLLGEARIFTTFGGGITIWSAEGDINAGRGAKTTQVFSPEAIAYDNFASVILSPTVPTTGAGIATLAPIPGIAPGDVDLVAPLGAIDAGEAGIRVSGNANLAALVIENAANIQVQGKTTGVPAVAVPNVAAETAAASAGGAAQQAATTAAQSLTPAIITVEVIGYGGSDQNSTDERRKSSRQDSP